ncbi:hypothetical protein K450DRAFT_217647 [Umbelopsis ramanniana AG]|uniref:Required for respiratory growth protein 9, mitochondrial n=1 Tax=Umbelopsis ramanniana AG TaxID=1314678 RepID=A0AAD5HJ52_UMBRA|nr:uncharacterized protein K450DRAFT_217647 [Umbelopsis ramanniana AG]KAI8584714.1 hypothetical protein K450DRAFT_217647 [Umbelopsis ramanniana AG]
MSTFLSRSCRIHSPLRLVIQTAVCGRSTFMSTALSLESKRPGQNIALQENPSVESAADASPDDTIAPPEVDIFDKHSPSYWRKNKALPEYQRHKLAIREKLNGQTWQPRHRLSREAMDHMKQLAREVCRDNLLLHSIAQDADYCLQIQQDPLKWTAETLAVMYKKSPEAVRRILKSNFVGKKQTKKLEEDIEEDWESLKQAAAVRMRTISSKPSGSRQGTNSSKASPQFFSGYTVNKPKSNRRK